MKTLLKSNKILKTLIWIVSCITFPFLLHAQDTVDSDKTELKKIDEIYTYSIEELMNIEIVSATKKSQKATEAPAVITIITAQQIKERGCQTLGEALESVAGLDLLHDRLQYNLGIRGVNGGMRAGSRIVKLMIDGQPVSFRSSSENFLGEELIPISIIKRVEIIRGPGSALYGANAFLGVINIITKNGSEIEGGELAFTFGYGGKYLSDKDSFLIGGSAGDFSFIAGASINHINNSGMRLVDVPGNTHSKTNEKSSNEKTEPQSHFVKFQYEHESMGTITADFHYQALDGYGEFQDWGVLTHNNRIALANGYVRARYAQNFFDHFDLTFSAAYAAGTPLEGEKLETDDDTSSWITRDYGYTGYDITTEIMYHLDNSTSLTIGFDYTSDIHTLQTFYPTTDSGRSSANPGGTETGSKTFRNIGGYGQAIVYPFKLFRVELLNTLGLTAGVRYDYHTIYGDTLNWRAGAVYNFTETLYAKLLYGTSFKAPSSTQLYSNYIVGGGVIGNPDLKPEKAETLEIAVGGQLLQYFGLTINAFYNRIKDKVDLVLPIGAVSNITPENIAEITSAGIESELVFTITNLASYVNYSYQRSILKKRHPMRGDILVTTGIYPTHMIKFGVNYKIPAIFINLNIEGRYLASRIASEPNNYEYDPINYRTNRYSLDSYFLLDVMLSSHMLELLKDTETELRVKVYNVLNTEYTYPGFSGFDIPGFGRKFVVSLVQHF